MAFVRRDIWTLLTDDPWDPVTTAYARAVATMQSRPANDPTSWAFQAAIHGSYQTPPPGAAWNACQHANWYFLPWHRMYLYFFERIVRAAVGGDPDFALPYWNYDQPAPRNTLPKPFRTATLPGGGANPLFLRPPRRPAVIANGAQLSSLVTSSRAAMALTAFAGPPGPGFGGVRRSPAHFGGTFGAVEQTPHNDIHVQIGGAGSGRCLGGLMIDPNCAALDPIFWLHHANIDRLWNRWLALQGGRRNPTDPAWLNQSFSFYDEDGTLVSMTCAEVVDSAAQLDYTYDDEGAQERAPMSPTPPSEPEPAGPPELVAATDRSVELTGGRVSVVLSVPASTRARVETPALAGAARRAQGAVYLNVEDIEAPANPGVVYGVFLNAPPTASDAERARYHVGNVTLFGIESVNDPDQSHDSVPGFRHTFDITRVVAELSGSGAWDPDNINVTFEPITPTEEGARDTASPELAQASATPVRIGRVSLFVA